MRVLLPALSNNVVAGLVDAEILAKVQVAAFEGRHEAGIHLAVAECAS